MQISRGAPMEDAQTPFLGWVKSNASTANFNSSKNRSILLLKIQ